MSTGIELYYSGGQAVAVSLHNPCFKKSALGKASYSRETCALALS